VRVADRALNIDENRLTRASSLAAVDLIGTPSAVQHAPLEMGVDVDRSQSTVVKSLNSSIMHRRFRRLVGGGSVDGLASLDRVVMVDQ